MKKYFLLIVVVGLLSGYKSIAQEKKDKKFDVKISGFIKNDFVWDSRQVIAAREGNFLLWPAPEVLDDRGIDINAKSNFNFMVFHSRFRLGITGPDALGAKISGLMEVDFFGQLNPNINLIRMRHVFIKMNWTNTELLIGQYWNPLFVTGCYPGTASFNTGTPIQSFARNPQIRITQKVGSHVKLVLAALTQRDHATQGPLGASPSYLRNSNVPDLHVQLHYSSNRASSGSHLLIGGGIAYKTIVPRLVSVVDTSTYSVKEKVGGLTAMAFSKITFKPVTIKLQARYGENISDLLTISGFAECNVVNDVTGECAFTPMTNTSFWGEIHSNGQKIQVGLFGGYVKNNGTKKEMSSPGNPVFGMGTNVNSVLRVSPRIIYTINKLKFMGEIEYTAAAYGSNYDLNYVPATTTTVANTRLLLSVMFSF
jgi:hypothetical protein